MSEEGIRTEKAAANARLAWLLGAYQAGDLAAASEFVERLHPMLFRFFRARTGTAETAEDMVQECWMRVHRARSSYRRGEPVLPWIFAIARHTGVDQYRKEMRHARGGLPIQEDSREPFIDPRSGLNNHLAAGQVLSQLRELPEGQREVFVMMKVSGMSIAEIARATGSSSRAVKQKVYRACESLRKMFAGGGAAIGRGGPE